MTTLFTLIALGGIIYFVIKSIHLVRVSEIERIRADVARREAEAKAKAKEAQADDE